MKTRCAILLAAALSVTPTIASATLAQTGEAQTDFFASGPAGMAIDGKTSEFKLEDATGTTLGFIVPLGKLTTGIELRDHHMLEALEVTKYPEAKLEVPRDMVTFPAPGKESKGDVEGTFTLHGKSHPVTVHYKAHRDDKNGFSAEGKLKLNTRDYDIKIPSYLGVTVRPDMDIMVKFQATDDGRAFATPTIAPVSTPESAPTVTPTPAAKPTPKPKAKAKKK